VTVIALVKQLHDTWRSIDELAVTFTENDWKHPTGCPGWSVQDNLSHLVDYEATALGWAPLDHTIPELPPYVKNEMGARNEVGVDARRGRRGASVLAEFREVVSQRFASLKDLTEADLGRDTSTPVGPGTVGDLLRLRVMDTWSHEQDIRRALGRPGHTRGGAVETTVAYFGQFLDFVVAKQAGAPDGSTVRVDVGSQTFGVEVIGGRGQAIEPPVDPTVTLSMDPVTFAALVGGRTDARPDFVTVTGSDELGREIIAALAFMP
jgi:uncharacterized protein (TIGR03083 family)